MTMRRLLFICLIGLLALTACGQKGDLYHPDRTDRQGSR
jgi:predicted small lipoprotein YifL